MTASAATINDKPRGIGRIADGVAGLMLAGLLLPEAVAYAQIAGLPPGRAILAAVVGTLAYALIGGSRFAVVSSTSSAATILAASLASLSVAGAARDAAATTLTLMVGALFIAARLCRLGGLAGFMSRPVLRGFAFGLAIVIIIRQAPKLFGVETGAGSIWSTLAALLTQPSRWNLASLTIGLGALAALLVLRRAPRVPGALIVLVCGVVIGGLVDLSALGVATVGPAHLALSAFSPPPLDGLARMTQLAAPIALILFAESWGTIRTLALRRGDTISANRELAALGGANLAAALAQTMPVGAGFSASSANEAGGATSRWAVASGALALLALALFANDWVARIPEPMLAAVVVAALTHAMSPAPFLRLLAARRDLVVAIAAAIGVLAFGVLNGMLGAIALSIAALLYTLSRPSISELGQMRDSHDFVDMARHPEARACEALAIYRPNAPLIFANAETVLNAITEKALRTAAPTVILSLEESADLDSTAAEALGECVDRLSKAGRRVILARLHDAARAALIGAGLGDLAAAATFSVADAAALAGDPSSANKEA